MRFLDLRFLPTASPTSASLICYDTLHCLRAEAFGKSPVCRTDIVFTCALVFSALHRMQTGAYVSTANHVTSGQLIQCVLVGTRLVRVDPGAPAAIQSYASSSCPSIALGRQTRSKAMCFAGGTETSRVLLPGTGRRRRRLHATEEAPWNCPRGIAQLSSALQAADPDTLPFES
ncbi:hypothetical protein B0H21DRAFT_544724 [Amylocystis lapponica]|nr:hypothetical protein B0H21DRAFT_544724 [Amylocystis lapponica]